MAVFPFLLRDGSYVADDAPACAEGGHDALCEACIDAGIKVSNQDDEEG